MGSAVSFGTNVNACRKRVYYEGSDTIYQGMALCYNYDTDDNILGVDRADSTRSTTTTEGSQNEGRFLRVEKPATAQLKFLAGFVAAGPWIGSSGPKWIEIFVPNGSIIPVRGTESFTNGEKIYLANADYEVTNVPQVGGFCGYAMETIDRSSTEGLLLAKILPAVNATELVDVASKTTAYTVTVADHGKIIDNAGASGAVTVTLPTASTVTGLQVTFMVATNQNLALSPQAGDKIVFGNDSDVLADGEDLTLTPADGNDVGMNITLVSNGTDYVVKSAYAQAAAKFAIP